MTSALTVSLTVRIFNPYRFAKSATQDATTQQRADADALRVNKTLLPKPALAGIKAVAGAARTALYGRTTPYGDSRAISGLGFPTLREELARYAGAFQREVAAFVAAYPGYVFEAQSRLGATYNAADYPAADTVGTLFDYTWRADVLPAAATPALWRDLATADADALAAEVNAGQERERRESARATWERLYDVALKMQERLTAYSATAAGTTGAFRDSLVSNVSDTVDALAGLNVFNDPALQVMGERIRADLCAHTPQTLRDDTAVRQATAARSRELLAEMRALAGVE